MMHGQKNINFTVRFDIQTRLAILSKWLWTCLSYKSENKASPPLEIAAQKIRVRLISEALRHFPVTRHGYVIS